MDKPNVDSIKGLSPAIAVDQKRNNKNPRSTVGTLSEVYDYLKLLYTTIGQTYSPISGKVVKRDNVTDIVSTLIKKSQGQKVAIYAIVKPSSGATFHEQLDVLLQKGFSRIKYKGESSFTVGVITFNV